MVYIERLAEHHRTGAFSCGISLLDGFLRSEAYFDDEDYGTTWVVVPERGSAEVLAFYTLLYPYQAERNDGAVLRRPAIELKCLAVDIRYQNTGVGSRILRGLMDRVLESQDYQMELLLLVAISSNVRRWYLRRDLGFQISDLPQDLMTLYLFVNSMRHLRDADPDWDQKRYTLPPFFWRMDVSGLAEEVERR